MLIHSFYSNLFIIYFWLCWVFAAARGLSLVVASMGYSLLWCTGFSLRWLFLLHSTGPRCAGFSSCGTWAQQLWLAGSRVQAQQLWCTGLVALRHVGFSWTRARTRVPCIGRQILNHCATREAQVQFFQQEYFIGDAAVNLLLHHSREAYNVWLSYFQCEIDHWSQVLSALSIHCKVSCQLSPSG